MEKEHEASFKLYLREIGQTPLLTPQQEIELAAAVKAGQEDARQLMIKANLRLVVKIAHNFAGMGLPLLDLIAEGNIGLMKAVVRFDPCKGGRLCTYAAWWIKQSMRQALANQGRTIRLPVNLIGKISQIYRVAFAMGETLGREPTNAELASQLDMAPTRVALLRTAGAWPLSLDAPVTDGESTAFGELIGDTNLPTPAEVLLEKNLFDEVRKLLAKLDKRERMILTRRFGLDGGRRHDLAEVGSRLCLSKERIRQLEKCALAKLRTMIERRDKPVQKKMTPALLALLEKYRS